MKYSKFENIGNKVKFKDFISSTTDKNDRIYYEVLVDEEICECCTDFFFEIDDAVFNNMSNEDFKDLKSKL